MRKLKKRISVSISIPSTFESLLKTFDRLARMEYGRKGRSRLMIRAMDEYVQRHYPGNPQGVLADEPETEIDGSLFTREKAGVVFLKVKCRLSIRQIAKVTYLSRSAIYRILKEEGVKSKPAYQKKNTFEVNLWRERWMLFKRGMGPEEAFNFG